MTINPKLKEWFVGALMMAALTLIYGLVSKYTGKEVTVPPLTVVIEPPAGAPIPLEEFKVKLVLPK